MTAGAGVGRPASLTTIQRHIQVNNDKRRVTSLI
jgi:hypothetical protein